MAKSHRRGRGWRLQILYIQVVVLPIKKPIKINRLQMEIQIFFFRDYPYSFAAIYKLESEQIEI